MIKLQHGEGDEGQKSYYERYDLKLTHYYYMVLRYAGVNMRIVR